MRLDKNILLSFVTTILTVSCADSPRPKKIQRVTSKAALEALTSHENFLEDVAFELGLADNANLEEITLALLDQQADQEDAMIREECRQATRKLAQMIVKMIHNKLLESLMRGWGDEETFPLSPAQITLAHKYGWGVDFDEFEEQRQALALRVGLPPDADWGQILNQFGFLVDEGFNS